MRAKFYDFCLLATVSFLVFFLSGCATGPKLTSGYNTPYEIRGMDYSHTGYAILYVGKVPLVREVQGNRDGNLRRLTYNKEAYIKVPAGKYSLGVCAAKPGWETTEEEALEFEFQAGARYTLQTFGNNDSPESWAFKYTIVRDGGSGRWGN